MLLATLLLIHIAHFAAVINCRMRVWVCRCGIQRFPCLLCRCHRSRVLDRGNGCRGCRESNTGICTFIPDNLEIPAKAHLLGNGCKSRDVQVLLEDPEAQASRDSPQNLDPQLGLVIRAILWDGIQIPFPDSAGNQTLKARLPIVSTSARGSSWSLSREQMRH